MKVVILYRPNSEYGTQVDSFVRDFKRHHNGQGIEVLDVDTRDGTATASLYDIMQFPAILALDNSGSLLKTWEGPALPLMDELAYYTQS